MKPHLLEYLQKCVDDPMWPGHVEMPKTIIKDLIHVVEERDEFKQLFNAQWEADRRAVKRWQEAHPDRATIWPDRADMVVWLMEQLDAHAQGARDDDQEYADIIRSAAQLLRSAPAQGAPESLPADGPEEMLKSIATLMDQIETLREAVNAVLNWYGNDRLIAFPGKQLVEALGGADASTLTSTECPVNNPKWSLHAPCPVCGALGPWFENGKCVAPSSTDGADTKKEPTTGDNPAAG